MMAYDIPAPLRERFVKQARERYGDEGAAQALTEAVELWLAHEKESVVEAERQLNNQAFLEIQESLEREHPGQWAVIAHGALQGVGVTLDDVKDLAGEAHHRLIFRVGDRPTPERRLGWRIKRA
jgi:hypothetical protein